MSPQPLTCVEFVELVTDYLEGVLAEEHRQRFGQHMALCLGCEIYLDQIRRTVAELGELHEEHMSPTARQRLLDAFRDWKSV